MKKTCLEYIYLLLSEVCDFQGLRFAAASSPFLVLSQLLSFSQSNLEDDCTLKTELGCENGTLTGRPGTHLTAVLVRYPFLEKRRRSIGFSTKRILLILLWQPIVIVGFTFVKPRMVQPKRYMECSAHPSAVNELS